MARYNEILVGRFNRGLQKLFGIKGEPPVPQIAGEIMAVHPLKNGVENRYLESWYKFGLGLLLTGGAGQTAFRFRNPVGSNVVAVFEKIAVEPQTATESVTIETQTTNLDLTTVVGLASNVSFDNRQPKAPSLIFSQDNVGPIGLSLARVSFVVIVNTVYDAIVSENQELLLLPGDAMQVRGATVGETFAVTCWWRERFLEDSERS
jgi:hypothetical protein